MTIMEVIKTDTMKRLLLLPDSIDGKSSNLLVVRWCRFLLVQQTDDTSSCVDGLTCRMPSYSINLSFDVTLEIS